MARSACRPLPLFTLLLCAGGLWGQQSAPQTAGLPTLTQIEQIRLLTQDEANRGYPVRVQGVVTYYDAAAAKLFIQDSTAGIRVDVPPGGPGAKQGQLIEIEGVSEAFDFAPQIGKPRWKVIGQAGMPDPHRPTFDRMASTLEDSQWVEVEGIVRSAERQSGRLVLNLVMSGGKLSVLIPQFHPPIPDWLVDAEVRIRGACGALFNQKSRLNGLLLYVPSLDEVHIEKPAPADPFAIAAQPPFAVQRFSPEAVSGHRIHVRGVVTFQHPGRLLFISDGSIGLRVETRQPTVVHAGDRVDVVGFPQLSNFRPVLEDATFRLIGNGPEPVPIPVTARRLIEGDYDSELVSIEADLLDELVVPGTQTLILQDGSFTFTASMTADRPDHKLESLQKGSRLQVTGVCLAQKDENGGDQSFRILFDGSDDLTVIRPPSWWTARHASQVLGWAGLVILAVLAWVGVLRRRVKQQIEIIRQRLEREAALEEQYRDLFENANDLIQSVDPQGKFLYVNRAWREALGYRYGELHALSVLDVIHPDSRERCQSLFRRAMAGEPLEGIEVEFVTKSGKKVILEGNVNCRFVDGEPESTRGIFHNITARKKAEEALRESEERYRTLFENMLEGFAYCRMLFDDRGHPLDWVHLEVNKAFERLTGLTDLVGKKATEAIPEIKESNPELFEIFGRVALTGRPEKFETEVKPLSIWLTISVLSPAKEHFVAVFENITERKRAEAENLRLATAIEQAAEGVVVTDICGAIQYVNPAFTRLTGYSRAETLGQKPRFLKSGVHDLNFYEELWKRISAGNIWDGEIVNRRKDGSLYTEEMTIAPVRDSAGAITNFIAIKQDVTERKRAEQEIRQLNQDLERRVSARTAELEAINRELEAFTYSVSHDLRAPLRHIAGFAKMLSEEAGPRLNFAAQDYLRRIEESTQYMARLIDELLSLARVSRQDLDRRPTELNSLVEEVVRELEPECSGREIEWRIGRLPVLECDPGLIRIVFANLFSNAIKFSRRRKRAVIEVNQRALEDPPVVFVRDNGVGFDMKYADRLFGAFQRLHRAEEFEGTGVGLATVQRIVHRHGGRVWAEAQLGKGATVYFTLSGPAKAAGRSAALPEATNDVEVLLVEDNAADEALALHELCKYKPNLRVHVAHDGEQALDFLFSRGAYSHRSGKNLPALVLLDLELPRLSGKEVLQVIRMDPRTESLLMVILTGSTVEELPSSLRSDRGCYHIPKPLSVERLQQAIGELGIQGFSAISDQPSAVSETPTRSVIAES